eukprot:2575737-Pleurochrysis_carterae.AAC.1
MVRMSMYQIISSDTSNKERRGESSGADACAVHMCCAPDTPQRETSGNTSTRHGRTGTKHACNWRWKAACQMAAMHEA